MKMYLVCRYVDKLGNMDYGVNDANYLVGLFDSEEKANTAMQKAVTLAKETDFEDEYYRQETAIHIIPVETDKFYEEKEQIFLGGGFYVE